MGGVAPVYIHTRRVSRSLHAEMNSRRWVKVETAHVKARSGSVPCVGVGGSVKVIGTNEFYPISSNFGIVGVITLL